MNDKQAFWQQVKAAAQSGTLSALGPANLQSALQMLQEQDAFAQANFDAEDAAEVMGENAKLRASIMAALSAQSVSQAPAQVRSAQAMPAQMQPQTMPGYQPMAVAQAMPQRPMQPMQGYPAQMPQMQQPVQQPMMQPQAQVTQAQPAQAPELSKKEKKQLAKAQKEADKAAKKAQKKNKGSSQPQPTVTPVTPGEKPKKKSKILIIVVVIALILMVGGFGLAGLIATGVINDDTVRAVQAGQLPDKTEEQKTAEENRVIDKGMFDISIAPIVRYEDGNGWKVDLGNTPANHYIEQVTITEKSTGDVLYESPEIAPNEYVQYAEFTKSASEIAWDDNGTAEAIAAFTTYDMDNHREVNTTNTSIKLRKPAQ